MEDRKKVNSTRDYHDVKRAGKHSIYCLAKRWETQIIPQWTKR